MIKDLSTSLKSTLYERVSAPILGTYTLTWVLYNWVGVALLAFGSESVEVRIANFNLYLNSEDGFRFEYFYIPFIITIVTTVLSPFIQFVIYSWKERCKSWSLKLKEKFDSQLCLTLDQSTKLRNELTERFTHYEKELEYQHKLSAKEKANLESDLKKERKLLKTIETDRDQLKKDVSELRSVAEEKYQEQRKLLEAALEERDEAREEVTQRIIENDSKYEEYEKNLSLLGETKDELRKNLQQAEIVRSAFRDFNDQIDINSLIKSLNILNDWIVSGGSSSAEFLNTLIIHKFSFSHSYDFADEFFDRVISPRIKLFSSEELNFLKIVWESNDQIYDRRNALKDLDYIEVNTILDTKSWRR